MVALQPYAFVWLEWENSLNPTPLFQTQYERLPCQYLLSRVQSVKGFYETVRSSSFSAYYWLKLNAMMTYVRTGSDYKV